MGLKEGCASWCGRFETRREIGVRISTCCYFCMHKEECATLVETEEDGDVPRYKYICSDALNIYDETTINECEYLREFPD